MSEKYLAALEALRDAGKYGTIIPLLDEVLKEDPFNTKALSLLALAFRATKELEKSIEAYQILCMVEKHPFRELIYLSEIFLELCEDKESEAAARAAIELSPHQHYGYVTLVMSLQAQGRFSEALEYATRAVEIEPESADCHYACGSTLWQMGHNDQAIPYLDQALAINPSHSFARISRAACFLSKKQWQEGFRDYEHRWENPDSSPLRHQDIPVWDGRAFSGFLLLWKEQGVGDDIFLLGFLPHLLKIHADIVVEIDPRLLKICTRSFPSVFFLSLGGTLGDFAIKHALPLASLPKIIHQQSTLSRFRTPYLRAFPAIIDGRIPDRSENRQRIGLSWKTSRPKLAAAKSASLLDFLPLASLPGVTLVNLQYGDCRSEIDAFNKQAPMPLNDAEIDVFQNLENLAALVESCDIVITISNVTAHMACALNKPTWILVPKGRGLLWFWHLGENPSPWYPSARLIRQNQQGNWQNEIALVYEEIKREYLGN